MTRWPEGQSGEATHDFAGSASYYASDSPLLSCKMPEAQSQAERHFMSRYLGLG